jgi:hypothetical protein
MEFIDGAVVNVALPNLQSSLGATGVQAQRVVETYALFISSLLLIGGSLGDRFGLRRMFLCGVVLLTHFGGRSFSPMLRRTPNSNASWASETLASLPHDPPKLTVDRLISMRLEDIRNGRRDPNRSSQGMHRAGFRCSLVVHPDFVCDQYVVGAIGPSLPENHALLMTVSQEIATALPDSKESWRSLSLEAVRALYRAKRGGLA